MKHLRSVVFSLLALFFATSLQAQAPKYSNEFLAIGVGARALGMSNAYVASVDDVTAGYWNPAGILGVKSDMQLGLMHAEYFAGIAKYDYAGLVKPIDSTSAIGFSVIRFGVDDIPNTTELIDAEGNWDYSRITSFSAADYAFLFSYAKKDLLVPGLNLGGNFKIIHRKVGDFASAWGFGIDVGAHYRKGDWKFGGVLRDGTSTFNAWTFNIDDRTREVFELTNNVVPENSLEVTLPRLILGANRTWQFNDKMSLLAELDADFTFDGKRNTIIKSNFTSVDPHLGLEFGYGGFVFLRAGMGNFQQVEEVRNKTSWTWQPNLGIGLKIKGLTIDYALTDVGDRSVALYSNVFSLTFDLYKKGV